MGKSAEEERAFLNVLRATLIAFLKGIAPVLAVEIGRRAVPVHVRPSFKDVEDACRTVKSKAGGAEGTAAAAPATG
jgi:chemotaxis protein MotA